MGKLIGRDAEVLAATSFLNAMATSPQAAVVAGVAGIGKSTLWRHALELAAARGYRVLSCRPVESETKLSYTSLTDLISPIAAEVLPQLPAPQREVLEALLLISPAHSRHDQRALSTALGSVLDALIGAGPVLIAIDDARWLDPPSARVLRFAFRRLGRRPIGILMCMRTPEEDEDPLRVAR